MSSNSLEQFNIHLNEYNDIMFYLEGIPSKQDILWQRCYKMLLCTTLPFGSHQMATLYIATLPSSALFA